MTNQVNRAFEKRREIEGYVLSDGTPDNEDYGVSRDWFQYGYEAATQAAPTLNEKG